MKKGLILFPAILIALTACNPTQPSDSIPSVVDPVIEPRTDRGDIVSLNRNTIRDTVLGGWIGHAIGMGSGFEYIVSSDPISEKEGKPVDGHTVDGKIAIVALNEKYWEPDGQIAAGSIGVNPYRIHPISDPRVVRGKVYSDDDMHVDVMNQFIFREYGPKLGNNDIASAWKFYDCHDVGGGATVTSTISNSFYLPPYTGQNAYGCTGYWVTESWIENETLGMLFPYMYDLAEGYADMFTQVQGDSYGYYLGKLCSVMYSLAYEYKDPSVILEKAFSIMGKSNHIYEIYEYVKKCYKNNISWQSAAVGVVEKAVNVSKISIGDTAGFSINANAGMIFMGLIYGEGDFEKSIKITSLCGLDGDCTAATVGGILGMTTGFENLPEKYKNYLNGSSTYYNYTGSNGGDVGVYWGAFAYCAKNFPNSFSFDYLTDLTVSNIESVVKEYGGNVTNDKLNVLSQPLVPVASVEVNNYSFEKGDMTSWHYSGSEGVEVVASKAAQHIGNYGGLIQLATPTDTVKVYQNLKLQKDHSYKVDLWVNQASDREFRLYAKDSDNIFYKQFVNPLSVSNRCFKAEMEFKATSNDMEVGIEFISSFDTANSTVFGIDDLSVDDITRYIAKDPIQVFEAENMPVMDGAEIYDDSRFSNGKIASLLSDNSIECDFKGLNELQSIKVFYDLPTEYSTPLSILVDGTRLCDIPLPSTGVNNEYNSSNYAEIKVFIGRGTHTLTILNNSFDEIAVDRIEIGTGNYLLRG